MRSSSYRRMGMGRRAPRLMACLLSVYMSGHAHESGAMLIEECRGPGAAMAARALDRDRDHPAVRAQPGESAGRQPVAIAPVVREHGRAGVRGIRGDRAAA